MNLKDPKLSLNKLELAVLNHILDKNDPNFNILKSQIIQASVKKREFTGTGFFLYFLIPKDIPRLKNKEKIIIDDVYAKISDSSNEVGFILYIEEGGISMLEGYDVVGESWPENIKNFKIFRKK
jgi:hypothetical protein